MAEKDKSPTGATSEIPDSVISPGDEADPGTPGTGEDVCPDCQGSGRKGDQVCPSCNGTGRVVRGIGGA